MNKVDSMRRIVHREKGHLYHLMREMIINWYNIRNQSHGDHQIYHNRIDLR
jgi:hypothetical protein